MRVRILIALWASLFVLTGPVLAQVETSAAEQNESSVDFSQRQRMAAVDARMAAGWIASSYKVPDRVAEEMLYNGYSYAETLIAMAYMGEGLSLNEVLEQRRLQGGSRWKEIAETLGLDTSKLPKEISDILWFGRNQTTPPVIHFLPDPHPGIKSELVIPAFEPSVPSPELVERFKLNKKEIKNIRYVLDNPLGVSEADMKLPAGRGLTTSDWVMAGTIAYFKPFPMESMLAARVGEDIPWSEVTLAFGLRPDVLTQGPLSGVYPILSGYTPNTALIARKRHSHPETLPLRYDLDRITPGERRALEPLLYHHFEVTDAEKKMLKERELDLGETGIALALARMSTLDLGIILNDHKTIGSWHGIVKKYAIDLTGHPELKVAMAERDPQ